MKVANVQIHIMSQKPYMVVLVFVEIKERESIKISDPFYMNYTFRIWEVMNLNNFKSVVARNNVSLLLLPTELVLHIYSTSLGILLLLSFLQYVLCVTHSPKPRFSFSVRPFLNIIFLSSVISFIIFLKTSPKFR